MEWDYPIRKLLSKMKLLQQLFLMTHQWAGDPGVAGLAAGLCCRSFAGFVIFTCATPTPGAMSQCATAGGGNYVTGGNSRPHRSSEGIIIPSGSAVSIPPFFCVQQKSDATSSIKPSSVEHEVSIECEIPAGGGDAAAGGLRA
jgi:hypothetical protein